MKNNRRKPGVSAHERAVKSGDGINDSLDFLRTQLGKNRESKGVGGGKLGDRKIFVSEVRETFLAVEGNRIVDRAADAIRLKVRKQGIPIFCPDDKLVVNVAVRQIPGGGGRGNHKFAEAAGRKRLPVESGIPAARGIP